MRSLTTILLVAMYAFTNNIAHAQNKKGKSTLKMPQSYEEAIKSAAPVVEKTGNGSINWTEQFVEAKGQSVIDTVRFKNIAQARAMATRGAVVVAQRNLLEIVKGVNIVGETTVEDMITTSDVINTKVEGMIKGAQQVGEAKLKDGLIEVTMRVPLYSSNGIAPIVMDEVKEITDKIDSASKQQNPTPPTTQSDTSKSVMVGSNKKIAFNLNGKKIDPSMFPLIVDEKGNLVFDFSKVYDINKGQFPKYLQLSKDVMNSLGFKKGVEVIDLVQGKDGKLVINEKTKSKLKWDNIKRIATQIGKFALMLI